MKYSTDIKIFEKVYSSMIKKEIKDKKVLCKIEEEYKKIMIRAKDIGKNNMLLSSYSLAAFFIAMNRTTKLNPEENYNILKKGLEKSKLLKVFLGNEKSYFSKKKMEKRRKWSKQTYERKYENDWIVDVIEKTDDFEFGLDYKECGVCKLCQDEKCFELAKYLCKLDFVLVEIIGIRLKRTKTLAEGFEKCDFRFYRE